VTLNPTDLDAYLTTPPDDTEPTGQCAFCTAPIWLRDDELACESEHIPGIFCDDNHRKLAETAYLNSISMSNEALYKLDAHQLCCNPNAPVMVQYGETRLLVTGASNIDGALVQDAREITDGEQKLVDDAPWRDE